MKTSKKQNELPGIPPKSELAIAAENYLAKMDEWGYVGAKVGELKKELLGMMTKERKMQFTVEIDGKTYTVKAKRKDMTVSIVAQKGLSDVPEDEEEAKED